MTAAVVLSALADVELGRLFKTRQVAVGPFFLFK